MSPTKDIAMTTTELNYKDGNKYLPVYHGKLDDKLHKLIIKGIEGGLRPVQAFVRVGLSEGTYWDWKKKADTNSASFEPRYFNLFADINKAESEFEYDLVSDVAYKTKKSNNPFHGIVLLSRRFPERYSEKIIMDQTTRNRTLEMLINELRKPDKGNQVTNQTVKLLASDNDMDSTATLSLASKALAKDTKNDKD